MQAHDHIRLAPVEQRARIDWPARAFVLSYWNEAAAEKEVLLQGLMDFASAAEIFRCGGHRLEQMGLEDRARFVEPRPRHGMQPRTTAAASGCLRVRCAMRASSLARVLLRCYAALAAGSLILGAPAAAVFFLALGIFNLAVIGVAVW